MTIINPHITRSNGTILTAAIYNGDHQNHVLNAQALNDDKLENVGGLVGDGDSVVFDGTSGTRVRSGVATPTNPAATDADVVVLTAQMREVNEMLFQIALLLNEQSETPSDVL